MSWVETKTFKLVIYCIGYPTSNGQSCSNAIEVPSFLHSSLGGLVDSVLDTLSDGRELNSWQIHGVYPRHLHIQTPLRRMAGVLTHEGHPWALTIPGGKPSRVVSYTAHITTHSQNWTCDPRPQGVLFFHVKCTKSSPNSEVKPRWLWWVLGWVTAWKH